MKRLLCLLIVCFGCDGGGGTGSLAIESIVPDYGPLAGGTRVVLKGQGFLADGAAPNRVIIGGKEAAQSGAIDDDNLEVVLPPGDEPGPVDIIVFNRNGTVTATEKFRYSTPPSVTQVTPDRVIFNSTDTKVTVSGSGFTDEDAGPVRVLVNGMPAVDIVVNSDSELTFTALPGTLLSPADITVSNNRGDGVLARAFRYAPGPRGGLLVFAHPSSEHFLVFFDPVDQSTVKIPRVQTALTTRIRAAVLEEDGTYSILDTSRRWGTLDVKRQTFVTPLQTTANLPAMARVGENYFGFDRSLRTFGKFNKVTGSFQQLGAQQTSQSNTKIGYGMAADPSGMIYFIKKGAAQTTELQTVDPTNGTLGTAIPLAGTPHISDIRFFGSTLYGLLADGSIITINTTTGVTSMVGTTGITGIAERSKATALEVFE